MPGAASSDALAGALRYYDAQADDARHTMMVARTAAPYGATRAHLGRRSSSCSSARASGSSAPRVRDVETGRRASTCAAAVVINCTGVWTDDIQTLAGGRGQFQVRASKGVHIVVPRDRINSETGLILRTEKSVLFVIPWGTHWIIGTTDTDWDARPGAPRGQPRRHRLHPRPRQHGAGDAR